MDDIDNRLDRMTDLIAVNLKKVAVLGAQAVVLGQFHDAVVPNLTTLQRVAITRLFRNGIEDAMSMTDDVALPAEYHSELLELTNAIIAELGR